MRKGHRFFRSLLAAAAAAALTLPAVAQLQLPGAVRAPTPAGATTTPPGGGGPRREGDSEANAPKPVMVRAPGDRTLEGRTLALNGRSGVLRFTRNAGKLELVEMRLTGDRLSKVGESCTMSIAGGPFPVDADGRIDGLVQLRADVPACPFTLAILDGAVMVTHKGSRVSTGLGAGTCEIKEDDCRGYLAGFWGPPGGGIGPADSKSIEATRSEAEKNARANFRTLIRKYQGDRQKVREIAADQAGFSARREEVCRDYLREFQHGFCASRFTQARAVSLAAQLGAVEVDDGTAKPPPKPRPRRPPPQPGQPGPTATGAPVQLQPAIR
jgi:hypothetical protein